MLQSFIVLGMLFALSGINCAAQAKDALSPRITAIRAQLYYEQTGTFSNDILAGGFGLWNTIIGEGDAISPSNFTLVTIEISGKDVSSDNLSAEIIATAGGDTTVERRRLPITFYEGQTKFHIPILLYETGCQPIHIVVRLTDDGANVNPAESTIPFECGE